jgi:3-methyladenine DNA glycosylase/8-oxoguanine DNA glycosylase
VRSERALHPEPPDPEAPAAPNGTTVAIKRVANQIASTILSARASSVVAIKAGARLENPWLRAVLVAPSVHRFLTTLALGARDFRTLAALMVKPRSAVMMTFAADPNPGLDHEHFTGPAVVFVSTVNYPTRTAILQ